MAQQVAYGESISAPVMATLDFVGECAILVYRTAVGLATSRFEFKETIGQMSVLGADSVPIVLVLCFTSGATLSFFLTMTFKQYHAEEFIGAAAGFALMRELAPVLTAVAFAARAGSAMSAQLASMKTTEQIDALKMLSVSPESYLVAPRIVASVLMMPVLSMIGLYAAGFGGLLVALSKDVNLGTLLSSLQTYVDAWSLTGGLLKTPVFGFIVSLVCCQQGLRATGGALGVSRSTTTAVVVSIVLVYAVNYLLAAILFK